MTSLPISFSDSAYVFAWNEEVEVGTNVVGCRHSKKNVTSYLSFYGEFLSLLRYGAVVERWRGWFAKDNDAIIRLEEWVGDVATIAVVRGSGRHRRGEEVA